MSSEGSVDVWPSYAATAKGSQFRITFRSRGDSSSRGRVVFVPPFAEEMNKSRRMVALGARQLAEQGFEVVLFDLHGCGDSTGELRHATWQSWVEEIRAVLAERWNGGAGTAWLWALRAGALLATAAIQNETAAPNLLLWQPVLAGKQHLQQFLRLNSAAALLRGNSEARKEDCRAALARGESVEVAGYEITADLAQGIDAAGLTLPPRYARHIAWLEVSSANPPQLFPSSAQRVSEWKGNGVSVEAGACYGLPFWQTQEIAECPELLEATLSAVLSTGHAV